MFFDIARADEVVVHIDAGFGVLGVHPGTCVLARAR